jgi:cobalt-zinc-cadmium efflux system outer membrane protein
MVGSMLVLALAAGTPAQLPPPATLTIAEAVERARTQSPLRASAAAIVDGAGLAATLAGRPLNPLIDVRAENLGGQAPLVPDRDVFAVVTQPLELGGKRGLRRDVAVADRDVATLLLRTVDRQVALDTVRTYMRAVRARDVLDTLTTQRDGVATLVTTMRRRVDEGYAPGSDLLRFEAEAARMSAEVARTMIELSRSLTELSMLVGAPALITPGQLVAPSAVAPPRMMVDDLRAAVSQRPDVLLASARVERARTAAALERQRRIPDPSVSAGYKRTQGQNTAVAGVMMAIPLFDRNSQARALAEAAVRSAEFEHAAAQGRATAEAQASVAAAAALADSAARMRGELLTPAEGVRNAAQALFREGATDVLKLVDAERIYADVRREALSVAVDAYVAAIEARFAVAEESIP